MDDATKKRVVNNLKKAHGHLAKVITMAEDGAYPVNIVQQALAVQGFLKTVNGLVLEDHISNSIVDAIKSKLLKGAKKKKIIKEVLKLYDMAKR